MIKEKKNMDVIKDLGKGDELLSWTKEIGIDDADLKDPIIADFLSGLRADKCTAAAEEHFEMRSAILDCYEVSGNTIEEAMEQIYDFIYALLMFSQESLLAEYISISHKPVNPSAVAKIRTMQEKYASKTARKLSSATQKAMQSIVLVPVQQNDGPISLDEDDSTQDDGDQLDPKTVCDRRA